MPRGRFHPVRIALVAFALARVCGTAWSEPEGETLAGGDLSELSLEQLGKVVVTSVSRREEHLAEAPASVYVITSEDIRRSGAKTIPEALRLAPTLQVGRADANQYAISARGFNSVLANKMLVLIDGRIVYSPLFSGVFWEAQDLMLQDVDRIEVTNGPAGTSWGTNAVNGVINIVTRPATQTMGLLAAAGAGTDLAVGEARYGFGQNPYLRAYGKYVDQSNSELANGTDVRDASHRFLGGVRGRWIRDAHTVFVDAGGYRNEIDQVPDEREVSGYHVQATWLRQPTRGSSLRAQAYYERSQRHQPGSIHDDLDTYDFEFQHEFQTGAHAPIWGAGYRYQPDEVDNLNQPAFAFLPDDRILHYGHVFAEDALRIRERVQLTGGVRFEHNDYTGWETLPNARLSWRPSDAHFLWTAVSRAVRAPSRIDREFFSPGNPPHLFLAGGPNFRSEVLVSGELGYRAQPMSALSYSISGYLGHYDRLRSLAPTPSGPQFENGLEADVRGVEAWLNYRVMSIWRLSAGGFLLHRETELDEGSQDLNGEATLGADPDNSWSLRSALDVGSHGEIDLMARHVGPLSNSNVPGYTALDMRIGWRFLPSLEASVVGYNLFGPRHAEWGAPANRATFGNSFFGQLQYRL